MACPSSAALINGGGRSSRDYTANRYVTDNEVQSNRVKLDYDHRDDSNPYFQQLHASVYYRNAQTRQTLDIGGLSATGVAASRSRVNDYRDNILGGNLVADSRFATGAWRHQLTYGFDVSVSHYSTSSSAAGEWVPGGDGYPEVFPRTTQTNFGAYLQDEARWDRLSIVPGVRFDWFRMTPHADATYNTAAATSTKPTTGLTDNAVSPRLALLYEVTPALVPYVQYARGFRAPSAYQVNSYYNPAGSYGLFYQQVGNPNLRPETSNTFELGTRGKFGVGAGHVNYSLAGFAGRYNDFIDTKVVGGNVRSPNDPYTVQYVNFSKASIHGLEAKADWLVDDSLEVKGGLAWIRGTETKDGVTTGLDTVPPLAVVLGLRYTGGEALVRGRRPDLQLAQEQVRHVGSELLLHALVHHRRPARGLSLLAPRQPDGRHQQPVRPQVLGLERRARPEGQRRRRHHRGPYRPGPQFQRRHEDRFLIGRPGLPAFS